MVAINFQLNLIWPFKISQNIEKGKRNRPKVIKIKFACELCGGQMWHSCEIVKARQEEREKNQTNKFIKIGRKTFIFEPASVCLCTQIKIRVRTVRQFCTYIFLLFHTIRAHVSHELNSGVCAYAAAKWSMVVRYSFDSWYLLFVLWLPFENFVQNEWNYRHFLVASSPADIQAQKAQHELNSILFTVNRCVEIMCTLCARTRARSWPLIFPNFRVSLISNFSAIFNTNDCVRPNFKIHSKKKF